MKKLKRRAIICLIIAAMLFCGVLGYIVKFAVHGDEWVSFAANKSVYKDGVLRTGIVYDRNGIMLASNKDGERFYNDNLTTRLATALAVGDKKGNVKTGALSAFSGKLIGYNFITGTYSPGNKGRQLYLTLDCNLCEVAYNALDGRDGAVGVYNYETGEILCMVSTPSFDPASSKETVADSAYINKFISSAIVPGSIFKLVTLAAAIDNIDDLFDREFTCTGRHEIDGDTFTCTAAHGKIDIYQALCVSCNCVFGQLSIELGEDILQEYVDKTGLTSSCSINGISTASGRFTFTKINDASLGWAGIGQYEDLINPCSMMVYMGAIANSGKITSPQLISKIKTTGGIPLSHYFVKKDGKALAAETADKLCEMMKYNVEHNYGTSNYPNLDIYAKSGTAEVGGNKTPNAWFTGFIKNENYPYAFIVLIENGGSGSKVAGAVANTVLQAAVESK